MSSTSANPEHPIPDAWRREGLRHYAYSHYLQSVFGGRVRKISVDAGLGCPNRDGSLGWGGCVFCDPATFSPSRRIGGRSIAEQIGATATRLRDRYGQCQFIAYFQPGTNTYGPIERLRAAFEEAVAQPGIVGVAVGTRPDCVADDVLDLLSDLARRVYVVVEYGVQSSHDRSLAWLGRGHDFQTTALAIQATRERGLRCVAHVILGIPEESIDDMLATADVLSSLGVHGVKLHQLHAVRSTPLAEMVRSGEVALPSLQVYADWAVRFLERIPADRVIERLHADAASEHLVGPAWSSDGSRARGAIELELARRDTWQGRFARASSHG
ncbi:MAG: TIGR01212 family radical SAM protein [Planctomycetota bacterium]